MPKLRELLKAEIWPSGKVIVEGKTDVVIGVFIVFTLLLEILSLENDLVFASDRKI